jgi:hypothetical protein
MFWSEIFHIVIVFTSGTSFSLECHLSVHEGNFVVFLGFWRRRRRIVFAEISHFLLSLFMCIYEPCHVTPVSNMQGV